MVRAILADTGAKSQTRRTVKPQPETYQGESGVQFEWPGFHGSYSAEKFAANCCPYGVAGDRLWVREAWCELRKEHWHYSNKPKDWVVPGSQNHKNAAAYSATVMPGSDNDDIRKEYGYKWKPSIHMPRWASRITLEVTSTRIEPLHCITEADAIAEGVDSVSMADVRRNGALTRRYDFAQLWEKINGKGSWETNPWVWVIGFKRLAVAAC